MPGCGAIRLPSAAPPIVGSATPADSPALLSLRVSTSLNDCHAGFTLFYAPVPPSIFISGASGKSVGLRVEVEAATVEVDGGLEVVPVAVAACRDADGLDA
jgi:hypothetical protein